MSEPNDNDLPDERQLDEYLQGESSVSRHYRQLHSAGVPAELDRLVLRQAQNAVKARPAKSRTWVRWTAPLALAASAVLVVSIVIESGVNQKTVLTSGRPVATVTPAPAEAKRNSETPSENLAARTANVQSAAESGVSADVRPAAPPVANAPVVPLILPQQPSPVVAFEPAPEPALDVTVPEPAMAPAPPRQADPSRRENHDAAPQAMARSAPPPSSAETDLSQIVVTGSRSRELAKRAGPRDSVVSARTDERFASSADEEEAQPPIRHTDPEAWLTDIRRLRAENKQDQADAEWRRFLQAFPNHPVAATDAARPNKK